MRCGITGERWTDYLDGAFPARERREIEAHLRTCADCRSEVEILRRIDQRLRIECGLFAQSIDAGLQPGAEQRVLATLRESFALAKPREVHERLWRIRWVLAMLCGPNTAGRIIETAAQSSGSASRITARGSMEDPSGSVEEQSWLAFLRRLVYLTTEICGCHAGDLILAVGR